MLSAVGYWNERGRQTGKIAKPFPIRDGVNLFLGNFRASWFVSRVLGALGFVNPQGVVPDLGSFQKFRATPRGMQITQSLAGAKQWTIGEQMLQQRAAQARIRLESEVRALARQRGASLAEAAALAQQSRAVFAIVNGEPQAMVADGKTPLEGESASGLLAVQEWVAKQLPAVPRASTLGPTVASLPPVQRNPWRRLSWNLTEQMRLLRRDPELARRLRDEAAAE
jgi:hypothetical protein